MLQTLLSLQGEGGESSDSTMQPAPCSRAWAEHSLASGGFPAYGLGMSKGRPRDLDGSILLIGIALKKVFFTTIQIVFELICGSLCKLPQQITLLDPGQVTPALSPKASCVRAHQHGTAGSCHGPFLRQPCLPPSFSAPRGAHTREAYSVLWAPAA